MILPLTLKFPLLPPVLQLCFMLIKIGYFIAPLIVYLIHYYHLILLFFLRFKLFSCVFMFFIALSTISQLPITFGIIISLISSPYSLALLLLRHLFRPFLLCFLLLIFLLLIQFTCFCSWNSNALFVQCINSQRSGIYSYIIAVKPVEFMEFLV